MQKETLKSNPKQPKSVCRAINNKTECITKGLQDGDKQGTVEGDVDSSAVGEIIGNINGLLEGDQHGDNEDDLEMAHIADMWQEFDQQKHINERMNISTTKLEESDQTCPQTPIRKKAPGSLLYEIDRPASPTGVNEFPFFPTTDLNDKEWTIGSSSLPKFKTNKTVLNTLVDEARETQEWFTEMSEENFIPRQVQQYTVIADIGTYGRTFKICSSKIGSDARGDLADSGANCSMTANLKALANLRKLAEPITIGLAVSQDGTITSTSECTHIGDYTFAGDDGKTITTPCFYNPDASDTIISPQAIVDQNKEKYQSWTQVGRGFGQPGQLVFNGRKDEDTVQITLHQTDGLYFIPTDSYDIINENAESGATMPISCNKLSMSKAEVDQAIQTEEEKKAKRQPRRLKRYRPADKAKILESETWYMRMGGCNETQLELLPDHTLGLPSQFEWHPFRYIDFKEQARIRKQPVGRNPIRVSERGRRFYMDFGFIRASNSDYTRPSPITDRVIESFDGYSSYLLIVDEVSKYTWIFLTKTKEPPIELTRQFMREFANDDGGFIRCDQGGELAKSTEWRSMVLNDFQYKVEPTGADSPSQNGQVERFNDTVATVVRTLLYGANLPPKYWSAAATHAVYLMNRRVHSGINKTPYEAWWDEKPDLSNLKIFGSRVCVRRTGQKRSKLDRHDFTGIFVGYTATDENIKYIDIDSGLIKTSHHAVFDEAWYLQPSRPPMAQLLYDLGMEVEDKEDYPPPNQPRQAAPFPPLSTKTPTECPAKAKMLPIPIRLSAAPQQQNTQNARAAKVTHPYHNTTL